MRRTEMPDSMQRLQWQRLHHGVRDAPLLDRVSVRTELPNGWMPPVQKCVRPACVQDEVRRQPAALRERLRGAEMRVGVFSHRLSEAGL